MKKNNKALRVAAGLAVAAMLSTCLVSGTFAKYTTSGNIVDSARVAKFGVTVQGGGDAFKTAYSKDDQTFTAAENTVVSQTTDKIVAPGTTGTFAAATVSGKPEVAVHVANVAEVTLDGWTIDTDTFYCPLTFKVNGQEVSLAGCNDAESIQNAIQTAVAATSKDYAAGTDLSADNSAKIEWAWAFDGNDANDTKLGNLANAPTVSIKVTTTVTQID